MKKHIIFLLIASLIFSVSMYAQDNTMKGKVLDDSTGQGLSNASIILSGDDKGTHTDDAGNFMLTVPYSALKGKIHCQLGWLFAANCCH